MQRAKPKVFQHLKVTRPPYTPPVGGSSNVIGMASETTPEKKKLVWDFIKIVTSDAFQSKFASMAASTPPSPRADTAEAKKLIGHFDLLVETQKAAATAGVDRIPRGLEIQFNAFAKMVAEEAQRMIIQDLDPAAVAKTMQAKALQIQQRR
jgi:multiple sugar transport system substrate-binding protein